MKSPLEKLRKLVAPGRYYGSVPETGEANTIHDTGVLDVETHRGVVVSVWFRCQMLPFRQTEVEGGRATSMESAYRNEAQDCGVELHAVVVTDEPRE